MGDPLPHLELIEIELVRTGEGDAAAVAHIAACAPCRAELAQLQELAASLATMAPPTLTVPDGTERQILWNARKRAALVRKSLSRPAYLADRRWAAAALVVLALAAGGLWSRARQEGRQVAGVAETNDLDRNGRVDILDAFALARRLGAGSAGTDVNGDGMIDTRDVDALAQLVVHLDAGRS